MAGNEAGTPTDFAGAVDEKAITLLGHEHRADGRRGR